MVDNTLLETCTAIILAGGSAKRMGEDKRFLKVKNENLLEMQVRVLKKYFPKIIISANDPEKLEYLNLPIVKDENEGKGPLEGLTSVLAASTTEHNFVIAVDIPQFDIELVKKMRSHLPHSSAVIPVSVDGKQEPLFAFYDRACIPIFREALKNNERAIHRALKRCPVYYYPMQGETPIINLNHQEDYESFISEINS